MAGPPKPQNPQIQSQTPHLIASGLFVPIISGRVLAGGAVPADRDRLRVVRADYLWTLVALQTTEWWLPPAQRGACSWVRNPMGKTQKGNNN